MSWLAVLLACAEPGHDGSAPGEALLDEALATSLQEALDEARDDVGAPGATQVVLRDGAIWRGASGRAVVEDDVAAVPQDRFRLGSITKMYVAAVATSLAHEGVLSLDDLAARWVPDAPHGERYTLRQALGHQTGLPDYVTTGALLTDLDRPWSPAELLALVADEALLFEPGELYSYSNTNFVVVGLAIEAATGRPWGEAVRERLLEPLGLVDTFFPTIEEVEGGFVHGYQGPPGHWVDVTWAMDPSVPWASGEMIASAEDVARFAQALVEGDLVAPEVREALLTEGSTTAGEPTGYGLGLSFTDDAGGVLVGHSGSTMGFQSRVHVRDGTVVCSLVNDFVSEADVLDAAAFDVLDGAR